MSTYFRFQQISPKGEIVFFTIRLDDEDRIREARAIIAGLQTDRVHVQGTIVAEKADYNPAWSYHLAPASIGFFENQIEVCDANMALVQEHLDEVGGSLLPHFHWCPWSSQLTDEIA